MIAAELVGVGTGALALACVMIVLGAAVQGSIGFGLGLLAAPVLAMVDPDFLPVTVVVAVIPLGIGVIAHDHAFVDRGDLAAALLGRLPGVAAGTWLVHHLGHRAISVVIGVSVLLAVLGSVTTARFRPTRRNLLVAGLASGITGTASGIGGPPMALTYQHADGRVLRATLATYFAVGGLMSLVALSIGGEVGSRELRLAALLIPASLVGLVLSRQVIRVLPARLLRPLVLVLCTASATALLVETFV